LESSGADKTRLVETQINLDSITVSPEAARLFKETYPLISSKALLRATPHQVVLRRRKAGFRSMAGLF